MKNLKIGKFPDNPEEVGLNIFIPLWTENNFEVKIPHWNLQERSRDSIFVYFFENDVNDKIYIKVLIEKLNTINYLSICGDSIRGEFYNEIIPYYIKNYNNKEHSLYHFQDYAYEFIDSIGAIKVNCQYIIKNDIGKKVMTENFEAIYNISNRTFK